MAIFYAIERRDEEEVLRLLEVDLTLLEVHHPCGDTPLIRALRCDDFKMAKLLLEKGANIHAPGRIGTALHYAANWGCEGSAAFLLRKGADAHSTIGAGLCRTPLMLAANFGHVGVAKLLLRHTGKGALEARDAFGRTALHLAARAEHMKMVAFLLSRGAQADSKDDHGMTALMSAAGGAPLGMVKLLLRHTGRRALETGDRFGRKALHHAVRFERWEEEEEWEGKRRREHVVALLLSNKVRPDSKDMWGRTPLMVAVRGGRLSLGVVKMLVDHTPRQGLDAMDVKLRTALHHAACGGNEEAATLLLSRNARADIKDYDGQTPLILACEEGRLGVVRTLLQHKEKQGLQWRDGQGRTALHYAAIGGHEEIVALLLTQNAQADTKDWWRTTPLISACEEGHLGVVRALLQHKGKRGLQWRDDRGRTALHYAANGGHEEIVTLLLSRNAQADTNDHDDKTPLISACEEGHLGVVQALLQYWGRQDLQWSNYGRWSALHYAAEEGHEEIVTLLLLAGADDTITCWRGETPRTLAEENKHRGCVKVFDWWEARDENARRYLLERARCLYDTYMTHRHTPSAPVPAFLQGRVAAGEALPQVDVVARQQKRQTATAGATQTSSEAHARQEAERHAVLSYVMTTMNDQLFTEFMQGFRQPTIDFQAAAERQPGALLWQRWLDGVCNAVGQGDEQGHSRPRERLDLKKVMSRWHQHGEPSAAAIRRSAMIDRAAFNHGAVDRPHLGPARMLRQYMSAWSWLQQSSTGSRQGAKGSRTLGGPRPCLIMPLKGPRKQRTSKAASKW